MQPLEGITVVALEQAVAAPLATRHLADLGARVIKIERPGVGDFARAYDTTVGGLSSHFVWLNRSKQSLTLDVKAAEARAVLGRLLTRADVFVQNLAPSAAERVSLGTGELRQKYPRLIVCNLSGYGASGPYRDKKAYDLLIQSEAGLLSITGTEEEPSKAGISVADIAGGMYAYSAILTALFMRQLTGQGTTIEVSLFEALGEWMGYPAYYTKYGGKAPARTGAAHAAIAPYGPFESGDQKRVFLGVQNEREWERFCRVVLQRRELATDPRFDSGSRRVANRRDLHVTIEEVFSRLTASEIIARLEEAQIANARMNSVQEFIEHPQLASRKRWREIDSPVGKLSALIPPVDVAGVEPVMGPIPSLGQHSDLILTEIGFDAPTVQSWRERGVI
ncbi:MAG: carnitine dehydratase [Acidobacteria bacterium]|nr:MAG: carnitine dehydratase [Acidobacteriota bacterium]